MALDAKINFDDNADFRHKEWDGLRDFAQENITEADALAGPVLRACASEEVKNPSVILLDEPAAGVNASLLETIIDRIREINARGVTFLLIEHNIDMVSRLCHRVMVMASGALLCEGSPEEVARDPRVIEAYLGGAG